MVSKVDKENSSNTVLVCSAWPYASGVPHLGNIQTSLLSGGVFTRYYKLQGFDTLHVSGSDAHGTRIEYEAEKRGISPAELANETHEIIVDLIDKYDIEIDNYTITTNETHHRFVREIHEQMDDNGFILTRSEDRAYCTNCEKFLADRFIVGTCPKCNSEEAHGNQCDSCGSLLEPEELIQPRCAMCGSETIEFRSTKHWYLDLARLQDDLEQYVSEHTKDWHQNVMRFTTNMIEDGLEPKAITRDIEWGIPAPFEGAESKVIYVWAEAALGYVSATMEYFQNQGKPERWKDFWLNEDSYHIYTHAKDNIPFHTLFFPGQLIASEQGYHLPDEISASEYLNWIGGKSFSKSKGVGVYANEALDLLNSTYWRFYLLYFRPERRDVDFSWKEIEKAVNHVLIDNVSNFINRVTSFAYSRYEGDIPDAQVLPEVWEEIHSVREGVEEVIEEGFLSPALRSICELANYGNSFFQREKPWVDDNERVVVSGLQLAKSVAIMLEPFVPAFSGEVYNILELEEPSWENISEEVRGSISEPDVLLEKPDFEEIKANYEELKSGPKKEEVDSESMGQETVDFERFSEMELKIGSVVQVESIEGADRLYRLAIDVGAEETLQSVSGLKESYSQEELLDKKVAVLTNLEPAEIHGVKSECMLLAAVNDEISLLVPDREVQAGTPVE